MSSSSTASKLEKEKLKLVQEKCQTLLNEMLRDEDNKYCVDCDAKGPRWASWNLGIFLCIRCAGIHRNLGVHISRVKSVNLDTWTPEQVVTMQHMGNSRARAVYEANMPDSFRRPQTDVALESFIRAKYEHKKYIAQEWVQPSLPKVNWDSEIEESIRKKKEAKKQVTSEINLPSAIPKPKPLVSSNSTTPNTSKLPNPITSPQPLSASAAANNNSLVEVNGKSKSAPSDDLLGLMTSDDSSVNNPNPDPFASPVKSAANTNLSASDELGNIFTSPELPKDNGGSGKKMTKESILSLYGQNSGSTVNPFASPASLYSNQSGTGAVGPSPGSLFSPYGQQQQPQQQQQQQQQQFNPNLMGQGGLNTLTSPPQNMSAGMAKDAGMNNFFNLQNDISQMQQQMHGMNLPSSTFSNFPSGGGAGGGTFQTTSNSLLGNFASVNNQAGIQAGIASFLGPSGTATPFAPQISQNKNPGPFF